MSFYTIRELSRKNDLLEQIAEIVLAFNNSKGDSEDAFEGIFYIEYLLRDAGYVTKSGERIVALLQGD